MVLRLSTNMILCLGVLFASSILFVAAEGGASPNLNAQSLGALKKIITLSPDHEYYDSSDFDSQEMAASAVSPFCKSFTFLCHVRCLQRGDPHDAGNFNDALSDPTQIKGEINRCTQVPGSNSIRILCLCNNGVDLTAEVSYALEGVVDIKAAGGDGIGTGEVGRIREVVYDSVKTKTEYKTVTVTKTETVTVTVVASPVNVPAKVEHDSIELSRTKQQATKVVKKAPKLVKQKPKAVTKKLLPKKQAGSRGKAAQAPFVLEQYPEAGDESYLELGDWIHNPDAYQEPYFEKEYALGTDDQDRAYAEAAEVEAEDSVLSNLAQFSVQHKPASFQRNEDDDYDSDDNNNNNSYNNDNNGDYDDNDDDNSDANINVRHGENRHGRHKYDKEYMYPPFDIESVPAYKNTIPHPISNKDESGKHEGLPNHQRHRKHKKGHSN
ncbi:hypothetical protein BGZ76_003191 [Entomortierella beljakovae]|nr:hypothetical protein BGZ76_003191 [Entomortierella beljakovae]